ncbi:hypothetical protein G6F31_017824 [Rhizopus arrhizus]|nr:hypothetical protein G6F31_017824 [Rhizopus arrhizus]
MFAVAPHAENGGQGLARRKLQPDFLAVIEHLHGRNRGIARQTPVKSEATRGRLSRLPRRARAAIGSPACARAQAGQACHQAEDSYHASPHA